MNGKTQTALATLLVLSTAALPAVANAQENRPGNVEFMRNLSENTNSSTRTNLFFCLPGGIRNHTYCDYYKDGNSYFGKSISKKRLIDRVNATIEVKYTNWYPGQVGAGISYTIPTPEETSLNVKLLPFWMDRNGRKNFATTGGSFRFSPVKGVNVFGFADIYLKENGAEWGYGELEVYVKPIPGLEVGIKAQLQPQGRFKPKVEPAPFIRYIPRSRHKQ